MSGKPRTSYKIVKAEPGFDLITRGKDECGKLTTSERSIIAWLVSLNEDTGDTAVYPIVVEFGTVRDLTDKVIREPVRKATPRKRKAEGALPPPIADHDRARALQHVISGAALGDAEALAKLEDLRRAIPKMGELLDAMAAERPVDGAAPTPSGQSVG